MANYMSYGNAEDLFEAIGTKKDNKPIEISWTDYNALTDEERAGNHYIITGAPGNSTEGHVIENSSGTDMTQRTNLQFKGTGVTVSDDSTNDRTVIDISGGSGGAQDLEDLDDVTITSATAGQVLTKSSNGWVNADLPSGVEDLDDLSDVTITSATEGQVLTKSSNGWVNADPTGGVTSFNGRTGAITPAANDYTGAQVSYSNTSSGLSATTVQAAIDEVLGKIPNEKWSSAVSCTVGATTCTIQDAAITTNSIIEDYSQNASGTKINVPQITVTTGQAVLGFSALTEATDFKIHIIN